MSPFLNVALTSLRGLSHVGHRSLKVISRPVRLPDFFRMTSRCAQGAILAGMQWLTLHPHPASVTGVLRVAIVQASLGCVEAPKTTRAGRSSGTAGRSPESV